MTRKWIMASLLGLAAMAVQAEVTVTNLVVAQRLGTKLMDISYDVSSTETNAVTVSLAVSNRGLAVGAPSVTGDVGVVPIVKDLCDETRKSHETRNDIEQKS